MQSYRHLTLVIAAAVLAAPGISFAQARDATERAVTLVQLDAPATRPVMVYRLAGTGADREIIALAPTATPDDLAQGLRMLRALRERYGPSTQRDMAVALRKERRNGAPDRFEPTRRRVHGALVANLQRAQRRQIAGFGKVRALVLDR